MTADETAHTLDDGGWTRGFVMGAAPAEPRGYLAGSQTRDNIIHLISSRLHYRFNLAWLRASSPEK